MIDPENYRVTRDTEMVNVEDADVIFQGAPLDTERIEEIVSTVRTGREKNLIPGGKSLSGDGKHSPVVRVRLPEPVRDELVAQAKARGVSVSKYTRKLIEDSLRAS